MKPLVSVITITYNHASYIRECIEGILMQKTTFPFELVIGEDCSTDGTRAIVLDYAQKYPEIIRLITSETNVGMFENSKRSVLACRGKYTAWCEGDDYWTDPYKLQKQVDFLEKHPDYSMCCHASKVITEKQESQAEIVRMADTDKTFTLDDFLAPTSKNFIRSETIVYRREMIHEEPEWFRRMVVGDYPLFLLLAYRGNIHYIDQVMSVYRKHPGGIWTSNSENSEFWEKYLLSLIDMYQGFDEYSDYFFHKKIRIRVAFLRFLVDEKHSRKNILKYWKDMPLPLMSYIFVRLYVNPPMQWIRDNFITRIRHHFIVH